MALLSKDKVNYHNFPSYKDNTFTLLNLFLCEDVILIILEYLKDFYKHDYLTEIEFKKKIHRIIIDISDRTDCIGLKFGGARNDKVGDLKGYGVFISGAKEYSATKEYIRMKGIDYTGFQILRYNSFYLNGNSTIKKLKEYIKKNPYGSASLKLLWNPMLLKNYDFN